jgi:hypothetical protein
MVAHRWPKIAWNYEPTEQGLKLMKYFKKDFLADKDITLANHLEEGRKVLYVRRNHQNSSPSFVPQL